MGFGDRFPEDAPESAPAPPVESTEPRRERCNYCGNLVTDWVDPDWARGRICRKCEPIHEPAPVVETYRTELNTPPPMPIHLLDLLAAKRASKAEARSKTKQGWEVRLLPPGCAYCSAGAAGNYHYALLSPTGELRQITDIALRGFDLTGSEVLPLMTDVLCLEVPCAEKDEAQGEEVVCETRRHRTVCPVAARRAQDAELPRACTLSHSRTAVPSPKRRA
jgi:hypothetical protein